MRWVRSMRVQSHMLILCNENAWDKTGRGGEGAAVLGRVRSKGVQSLMLTICSDKLCGVGVREGGLAADLGCVRSLGVLKVWGAGLTSQQWGQKKAAAKSLADLAEAGGNALPPHTPTLISTILQVVPPLGCVRWYHTVSAATG